MLCPAEVAKEEDWDWDWDWNDGVGVHVPWLLHTTDAFSQKRLRVETHTSLETRGGVVEGAFGATYNPPYSTTNECVVVAAAVEVVAVDDSTATPKDAR